MIDKVIEIRKKRAQKAKRKNTSRFLIWLLIVALMLGIILYIIMDMSKIRSIIVTGNDHYTKEEIIIMADIKPDANFIDVFFYQKKDYTHYPYVKTMSIEYSGFNNIHIVVKEKSVINYIAYQGQYVALDKEGVVIDYVDEIKIGVPIIEGLYLESVVVGEPLIIDEVIIRALLDLHHLRTKYNVPLTKIDFPYSDTTSLDVYVNDIRIIFGEPVDLDIKMKNAGDVMKKLQRDLSGSLDLREDKEQFIFKEKSE